MEIQEQIGDVQGKAATLNNMAQVIAQQGDINRAITLWEQIQTLIDYLEAGDRLDDFLEDFPTVSHAQATAFLESLCRKSKYRP